MAKKENNTLRKILINIVVLLSLPISWYVYRHRLQPHNEKSPIVIVVSAIFWLIILAWFISFNIAPYETNSFILKIEKLITRQTAFSPPIPTTPVTTPQPNEYRNDFLGLNFFYPEGWKLSSGTTEISRYINIVYPEASSENGYIPNIQIVITQNGYVSNPSSEGFTTTEINDIQGLKLSYTGPQHSPFEEFRFEKNGYFYAVTLLYDKGDSETVEKFNNMLSTFKFDN